LIDDNVLFLLKIEQTYVRALYSYETAIEDEEYVKWMFMLGEYYRGQGD
jgi:hypothetical protein